MTSERFVRRVFLDTQVFKSQNFDFDARPLKLLKALHVGGRAALYITDVVNREVRARMRREVEDARAWYNRLRKDAKILLSARRSPFYALPQSLDVETIAAGLFDSFDRFIINAGVKIVYCSDISTGVILEKYFSISPPFDTGEKRKEFPDAISIEAVAERFRTEGIYVISNDHGIREACVSRPGLAHLSSIEEYLRLELADHEDVAWISAALYEHQEEIEKELSNTFSDSYFYLDDEDGEVESVDVTDLTVNEIKLVNASEFNGEISVDCSVQFSATVEYDDPNTTVYDEGEKYSFGRVKAEVHREAWETLSVTFELDRINKTVHQFKCDDYGSRAVSVFESEDYK